MILTVHRITIPPMSTIGYGMGRDEHGVLYQFCGDHRPMRYLGERLSLRVEDGDPIQVEVEDWQVVGAVQTAQEG
jgi:hypothetical protein